MSEIAKEIKQTIESLEKAEAIDRHYNSVVDQQKEMVSERDAIEKKLTKELNDVQALEERGIRSLFHNVLGNKSQQLEKERQEYLQISLKHTEHLKALKVLKYEVELLEKKVQDIGLLKTKLTSLKVSREREILGSHSPLRNQLLTIENERQSVEQSLATYREILKKGQAVIKSLDTMLYYFRKAKDWGNWDMAGNGRYADYNKHNAVNSAVNEANRTNMLLASFTQDLRSIGYELQTISLGFKSFSGFMDVLFDNLISDWIIQKKIKNALTTTESVKDRITRINASLKSEYKDYEAKYHSLAKQKDSLLES